METQTIVIIGVLISGLLILGYLLINLSPVTPSIPIKPVTPSIPIGSGGTANPNPIGGTATPNQVSGCMSQVNVFLSNLPTDVKSFVSTLNSGIPMCQNKVWVKMVDDTPGESDNIVVFSADHNGLPTYPLKQKDFKSGDLIGFKICSYLDTKCSAGGPDVWITLT